MWIHLAAVFASASISKQMPLEAARFAKVDQKWSKIMRRAHEIHRVVECCTGNELLRMYLPSLQTELETCLRSLQGYLLSKRNIFPRFYFVSDAVLLEMLSLSSSPRSIQVRDGGGSLRRAKRAGVW